MSEANQTEALHHTQAAEQIHNLFSTVKDLQQRVSSLESGSGQRVSYTVATPNYAKCHLTKWQVLELVGKLPESGQSVAIMNWQHVSTFAQATAAAPLEGRPGWNLWFRVEEKTQYILHLILHLFHSHRVMTQHLNYQPLLKVKQPRPSTKRQQMKHYLGIHKVQCWIKQFFCLFFSSCLSCM